MDFDSMVHEQLGLFRIVFVTKLISGLNCSKNGNPNMIGKQDWNNGVNSRYPSNPSILNLSGSVTF